MVQGKGTIKQHPLLQDCWVTGFPRTNSPCSERKLELCYHKIWAISSSREEMVALIRVSEDWVYGRLAQLLRAWTEAGCNGSGEDRMWKAIYFIESRKKESIIWGHRERHSPPRHTSSTSSKQAAAPNYPPTLQLHQQINLESLWSPPLPHLWKLLALRTRSSTQEPLGQEALQVTTTGTFSSYHWNLKYENQRQALRNYAHYSSVLPCPNQLPRKLKD